MTASTPSDATNYVDEHGRTDAEIYLTEIQNGNIIACKEMHQLADMMLPRFHEPYKAWHFDVEKAIRPVRFIEKYCCYPEGEKRGKPFILEQFQRASFELAYGFVDDDGYRQFRQVFEIIARKNGKALSLDTEIPTPDGWRTMADIHVGDVVFGQDGKPSTVTAESEIFDKPMYLVTFEDGAQVKASGDHIWTVQTKRSRRCAQDYKASGSMRLSLRKYRAGGWFETTTEEMFNDEAFVYVRANGKGCEYKYRVPMNDAVEYPAKNLPIDPYVFGAWLGDGTSSKPQITIGAEDEDEMVRNLSLRGHVITLHHYPSTNRASTYDIDHKKRGPRNGYFKQLLIDLNVLDNKHIPDVYMQGSIEQRWELLRGLMDTDGTCSKAGQCEFTQKRKKLAEQLVELCASLGIKASIHNKQATCNGMPAGTVYRVTFFTDKSHTCFYLSRKHARLKDKLAPRMTCKSIVSIERIPNEPSKCIAIDNESHLYLAGRQYTATHNTSKMGAIVIYMATSDSPRELGAEVYCCANSESQARKCYGAADAIREKSPMLNKHLRRGMVQKRGRTGILHDKSGSFIYPLSSNVNKLDGLSASATVFDEIMAAEDNGALLDVLEESTSARRQPFTWSISTENYVRHNVGDDRMAYAKGILDGSIHDDRFLPIIYKLDKRDEIYDEAMWVKANPGLGTIKSWEYLRDRVNKAKQSPSSMPSLLTKEFNLRSGAYSAYMDVTECVNNTPIDFSLSDVPYCVVGIDHAEKGDLAAAVARFMRPGDTNYYELARFWIPEKSIEINSAKDFKERDNVPYRQWAANGWVDIIPEVDRVNEIVFIDFLRELVDIGCYPFAVGYDQWRISEWADREMQRLIGATRVVSVLQYPRVISPLMKEHRLDLRAKRVICPNPCLHHCRINVQARTDNNDNDFPQKKDLDHRHKIDGYMAELHSLYAFHKFEEEYLSAIEWEPPEGQQSPFAVSG